MHVVLVLGLLFNPEKAIKPGNHMIQIDANANPTPQTKITDSKSTP